ncbi:hypothetical protein [Leifsonia sp. TF02-11]|uniref:hypothetical protein n=1 Tax=Leifsonia sp. TF02-11 TaxID=2815212 RepID=UPI001AA18389|nr:hypothetical protein [Leifsonia sp. TF02-11]MBO1739145.1 hypothetical protein [Leifsonia sp. TF02-11]
MTTWDVFQILRARWYAAIAIVLCGGIAFLTLSHQPGVYYTGTTVYFRSPGSGVSIAQDWQRSSLVAFAATVERIYDGGKPADRLGESATLQGAGITRGSSVLLPNMGGQWQYSFDTPGLNVKAAGPTPEWVRTTLATEIARIRAIAAHQQEVTGVSAENRISVDVSPASPSIGYSFTTNAMKMRALGAVGLLTVFAAVGGTVLIDLLARLRRYRKLDRELQLTLAAYRGEIPS